LDFQPDSQVDALGAILQPPGAHRRRRAADGGCALRRAFAQVVHWRDGYHTLVATMTAGYYEQHFHWKLEAEDPPPGREASRLIPIVADNAHQAAQRLEEALAWAARELGDHYTIAPLQDEHP